MRSALLGDMPHDMRIRRENFYFWVFCGVVGFVLYTLLIAYLATFWTMKLVRDGAQTPVRVSAVVQPDTLIGCPVNTHRLREWERTCRARDRITKVGQ